MRILNLALWLLIIFWTSECNAWLFNLFSKRKNIAKTPKTGSAARVSQMELENPFIHRKYPPWTKVKNRNFMISHIYNNNKKVDLLMWLSCMKPLYHKSDFVKEHDQFYEFKKVSGNLRRSRPNLWEKGDQALSWSSCRVYSGYTEKTENNEEKVMISKIALDKCGV